MPDASALVVVAAAIVRDGRVLAAQRSYPPELAGQWELPGGKVRLGEAEPVALQRECLEELGIEVTVHERVGTDLPTLGLPGILRVYRCTIEASGNTGAVGTTGETGEPRALEHASLRWLSRDELDGVAWLPTDRPLLSHLRPLL